MGARSCNMCQDTRMSLNLEYVRRKRTIRKLQCDDVGFDRTIMRLVFFNLSRVPIVCNRLPLSLPHPRFVLLRLGHHVGVRPAMPFAVLCLNVSDRLRDADNPACWQFQDSSIAVLSQPSSPFCLLLGYWHPSFLLHTVVTDPMIA